MNLIFRFSCVLVGLFGMGVTSAQENTATLDWDVLGEIGISYAVPHAYGSNFLSDGYDVKHGFTLDGLIRLKPKWFAGAQFNYFGADVTNTELIGEINRSQIFHFHAFGGYSVGNSKKRTSLKAALGLGYVRFRNEQNVSYFRDDGFSLMGQLLLSYRLSNTLGIYLKMDNFWDFMAIDSPSELESVFDQAQLFVPSLGIRVFTF
nr:hypothetical protein [Allomuricauda sp.]